MNFIIDTVYLRPIADVNHAVSSKFKIIFLVVVDVAKKIKINYPSRYSRPLSNCRRGMKLIDKMQALNLHIDIHVAVFSKLIFVSFGFGRFQSTNTDGYKRIISKMCNRIERQCAWLAGKRGPSAPTIKCVTWGHQRQN